MNYFAISIVETVFIIFLLYLIIFRKIGRPLSEAEVQLKIEKEKEKEKQKQIEEEHAQLRAKKRSEELQQQEIIISKMKTPVILVSFGWEGDINPMYHICVKDGSGCVENLSARNHEVNSLPRFRGLFNAIDAKYGNYKNGMTLIP